MCACLFCGLRTHPRWMSNSAWVLSLDGHQQCSGCTGIPSEKFSNTRCNANNGQVVLCSSSRALPLRLDYDRCVHAVWFATETWVLFHRLLCLVQIRISLTAAITRKDVARLSLNVHCCCVIPSFPINCTGRAMHAGSTTMEQLQRLNRNHS